MKVNPESFRSYSQVVGTAVTVSPSGRTWAEMASKKIPIPANGQSKRKLDIHEHRVYQVLNQKNPILVSTRDADCQPVQSAPDDTKEKLWDGDAVSQLDKTKNEIKCKNVTSAPAIKSRAITSYADKLKEKPSDLKIKNPIAESRGEVYIKKEKLSESNKEKKQEFYRPVKVTCAGALISGNASTRNYFDPMGKAQLDRLKSAGKGKGLLETSYADILKVKQGGFSKPVRKSSCVITRKIKQANIVDKVREQQKVTRQDVTKDVTRLWDKYIEIEQSRVEYDQAVIKKTIEKKLSLISEVEEAWRRHGLITMEEWRLNERCSTAFNRMMNLYIICFGTILFDIKRYLMNFKGAVSTNSRSTPKPLERAQEDNSVAESAPLEREKAEASTTTENIANFKGEQLIPNPGIEKTGGKIRERSNPVRKNPKKEEWLSVYQYAWQLRSMVLSGRYNNKDSPSYLIKDDRLNSLDGFLKHILSDHVLLLINKEMKKSTYQIRNDSLFVLKHYMPLLECFGRDPDALVHTASVHFSDTMYPLWIEFNNHLKGANPEKAFKHFDTYVYNNSEVITQQWIPREFDNCKYQIEEAIRTVIQQDLPLDIRNYISGLCEKFSKKGWVTDNNLRHVIQWAEKKTLEISTGEARATIKVKKGRKRDSTRLGAKVSESQLNESKPISCAKVNSGQGVPVLSSTPSGKEQDKEVNKSSSEQDQPENIAIKNPDILYVSHDDIMEKLQFNAFSNKVIQHVVPTEERVKKLLYGDETIYKSIAAALKCEKRKHINSLQQLAHEWLLILASASLRDNIGNLYGRNECADILVLCTRCLLGEVRDVLRADGSKAKYNNFLSANADLIVNTHRCLVHLKNSDLKNVSCDSLIIKLSLILRDMTQEVIDIDDQTLEKLNQTLAVVSLDDGNGKDKSNKKRISDNEPSCTAVSGRNHHADNEPGSKPEDVSTISSGRISWAGIVKSPVISENNTGDIKYEAEIDKADYDIHNLESESCTQAKVEESCVINPDMLYLSPEDIVRKLEFNIFTNNEIQRAVPTADRVKRLLCGNEKIYTYLVAALRYKKAKAKDKHNQQQQAREWLTIFVSAKLIENIGDVHGRKKCESIFVHCTRRLLDEAYDTIRADRSRKKYNDFLSSNAALLKDTHRCLIYIAKSGFEAKSTYSYLIDNVNRLLVDMASKAINMSDQSAGEEHLPLAVDGNGKDKSDKEMISENKCSCTAVSGNKPNSGNELVSKPEEISTISPGKISWAKIVKSPVIPWKKADVTYDAETDKADPDIHNLESEPSAQAEEICVIRNCPEIISTFQPSLPAARRPLPEKATTDFAGSGWRKAGGGLLQALVNEEVISGQILSPDMIYTSTKKIVDKLEFRQLVNKAIKNALPTEERVSSLLDGEEEIFKKLDTHLRYKKKKPKDLQNQHQLAREWLFILTSDDLINNIGNVKGQYKCTKLFEWCSDCLIDEAFNAHRSDPSKTEFNVFLSNNTDLLENVKRGLTYLNKLDPKARRVIGQIKSFSALARLMGSEMHHKDDQTSDKLSQPLAELSLDDGNGKDRSDQEVISASEPYCITVSGKKSHSDNGLVSKPEAVSIVSPGIKTWAQRVASPVISEKNKADVQYQADNDIHNSKIELTPLTEDQERVIRHALQSKSMALPVTNVSENESHTIGQNQSLSGQSGCLKKDLLDNYKEPTDELMEFAIKPEHRSLPNQERHLMKTKINPVKKDLKSVNGNPRRNPSALDVIQDGSYCDVVNKSFQNRNKETYDKAVIFLPQLVTELLKDNPISNKSSIVSLVFRLTFLYMAKAKDRIISSASGYQSEPEECAFLDLNPIRDVRKYLRDKVMLTSESEDQGFESIIEDIDAMERCYLSSVPSFVIERLSDLFSEELPDLGEICETLKVSMFLDFKKHDCLKNMLDNPDCLKQINQALDLLQALTIQQLFQRKLSMANAHNVSDILKLATEFDDRLSGSDQSEDEKNRDRHLSSNKDDKLCFKKIVEIDFSSREQLITCLCSYISDSKNDGSVSPKKQRERLDFRDKEIRLIVNAPGLGQISKKLADPVSLHRKPHNGSVINEYRQLLEELKGLRSLYSDAKPNYWVDQFYTAKQAIFYCSHVLCLVEKTVFGRRSRHSLSNCNCYHDVLKCCIRQFNKMNINGFFSKQQCLRMDQLLGKVFSVTSSSIRTNVGSSKLKEPLSDSLSQVMDFEILVVNFRENTNEIKASPFFSQELSNKAKKSMKLVDSFVKQILDDSELKIALDTMDDRKNNQNEERQNLQEIREVALKIKSSLIPDEGKQLCSLDKEMSEAVNG